MPGMSTTRLLLLVSMSAACSLGPDLPHPVASDKSADTGDSADSDTDTDKDTDTDSDTDTDTDTDE